MGTRIYPTTTDRAALEVLAGVPVGTFDLLDASQAAEKAEVEGLDFFSCEKQDIEMRYYSERANGHLGMLRDFLLFGWGKFRSVPSRVRFPEFWEESEYGYSLSCSGSANGDGALALAATQGISPSDLELAGGLCWS